MKLFMVQILGRIYFIQAEQEEQIVSVIEQLSKQAQTSPRMDQRLRPDLNYTVTEVYLSSMDEFVHEWL